MLDDRDVRRERLEGFLPVSHYEAYIYLVETILDIEEQLEELRTLPHYEVDALNPSRQKKLPAFDMYNNLNRTYGQLLARLQQVRRSGTRDGIQLAGAEEHLSPLMQYIKEKQAKNETN